MFRAVETSTIPLSTTSAPETKTIGIVVVAALTVNDGAACRDARSRLPLPGRPPPPEHDVLRVGPAISIAQVAVRLSRSPRPAHRPRGTSRGRDAAARLQPGAATSTAVGAQKADRQGARADPQGPPAGLLDYVGGRFYHRASRSAGLRVFILTHEEQATKNLFEMVERFHDSCPVRAVDAGANASELPLRQARFRLQGRHRRHPRRRGRRLVQLLHGSRGGVLGRTRATDAAGAALRR